MEVKAEVTIIKEAKICKESGYVINKVDDWRMVWYAERQPKLLPWSNMGTLCAV